MLRRLPCGAPSMRRRGGHRCGMGRAVAEATVTDAYTIAMLRRDIRRRQMRRRIVAGALYVTIWAAVVLAGMVGLGVLL